MFGSGYKLTKVRDLSQPGQYVCKERVSLIGPKGTIHNVVILGPGRKETQAEVSMTDTLVLGIRPPVRLSGDIADTPGITISNGSRQIVTDKGVIIAKRHMHITPCLLYTSYTKELFPVKNLPVLKLSEEESRPKAMGSAIRKKLEWFMVAVSYTHLGKRSSELKREGDITFYEEISG